MRFKTEFEFDAGTDKDADKLITLKTVLALEQHLNHKGTFRIQPIDKEAEGFVFRGGLLPETHNMIDPVQDPLTGKYFDRAKF